MSLSCLNIARPSRRSQSKEHAMRIGFIGLGPMGAAMARRLLDAGHELRVWNRSPDRATPLTEAGATLAASPAEAVRGADLAFTSVADDHALEAVTLGPDGLLAGLGPDAVHACLSTVSIALIDRLAEAHGAARFISTPVLGRPPAAAGGKLFVMAAGAPAAIERARPAMQAIGQRLFVVGEKPAQAAVLKLCCNFLIFSTIEQLGEVFALTARMGVDRRTTFEMLTESFFTAPVHKNYGRLIADAAFDPPGAKVGLGAKDTRLILQAGDELAVPLPFASIVRDRFLAAAAQGEAELDFSVIGRHASDDAGLPRT
jgi:3-hydroxyisobutyrate dehydrogenase-like beta-hydroxyacid dehydrogenase